MSEISRVFDIIPTANNQSSYICTDDNVTSFCLKNVDGPSVVCERGCRVIVYPENDNADRDKLLYNLLNISSKTFTALTFKVDVFNTIFNYIDSCNLATNPILVNSKWEPYLETLSVLYMRGCKFIFSNEIPENEFIITVRNVSGKIERVIVESGDKFSALINDNYIFKIIIGNNTSVEELLIQEMEVALA